MTGPRSAYRPRARRSAVSEIDAQSAVGMLYVRGLVRTQLRLALGILAATLLLVGSLPLLFAMLPRLARVEVAGMPLAWVILGFGVYPLFLLLGAVYVRAAGRNERHFRDMVTGPGADSDRR